MLASTDGCRVKAIEIGLAVPNDSPMVIAGEEVWQKALQTPGVAPICRMKL